MKKLDDKMVKVREDPVEEEGGEEQGGGEEEDNCGCDSCGCSLDEELEESRGIKVNKSQVLLEEGMQRLSLCRQYIPDQEAAKLTVRQFVVN